MDGFLTKGCKYALQALLYLASQPGARPSFQRQIATALDIPPHFLGKVLQMLVRSGLIISQRGKTGGFILGKSAEEITPYEVILAIDGPAFLDDCFLGFPGCNDQFPCPLHSRWTHIKEDIIAMLKTQSIAQLERQIGAEFPVTTV
ncbi:MAG: RrF2 family transcriptional regulator [bacterium]